MPTDTEVAKALAVGEISSQLANNANAIAEIAKQRTRFYTFFKTAADAMASTTTAEAANCWNRLLSAGRVKAIRVHSSAALTGDPTNNAVITVSKRDAAGANLATLGTLTTTASWVAGTSVAFTLTNANLDVVQGGSLTFSIAKGGTGVVVPICTIVVEVEDY
jgi:hypothetical protein